MKCVYLCGLFVLTNCAFAFSACAGNPEEQDATTPQYAQVDEQRRQQFLQRVENFPWKTDQKPSPRVFRDEEGKITRLLLDGMRIREGDMEVISSFSDLTALSLSSTNVSNQDLCHLARLKNLRGLDKTVFRFSLHNSCRNSES